MIFDDYLRKKIKKVLRNLDYRMFFFVMMFDTNVAPSLLFQSEDELLAEKKCVAHLTGEVSTTCMGSVL